MLYETNITLYVSCTSIFKKLIATTHKPPEFRLLFSTLVHCVQNHDVNSLV